MEIEKDIGEEIIEKLTELNKILDQKLPNKSENGRNEFTHSFNDKNLASE